MREKKGEARDEKVVRKREKGRREDEPKKSEHNGGHQQSGGREQRKLLGKYTGRLAGGGEKIWRERRYAKRYGLAGAER